MSDTQTLAEKITEQLTVFLESDPTFNEDMLKIKVANVIKEFKSAGPYYDNPTYWKSEAMIETDLDKRFFADIFDCAMYDYNQIGIEGQTQHNENGISRHYVERNKYFANIRRGAIF